MTSANINTTPAALKQALALGYSLGDVAAHLNRSRSAIKHRIGTPLTAAQRRRGDPTKLNAAKAQLPHRVTDRCPRCGGPLISASDAFSTYLSCLMCGYVHEPQQVDAATARAEVGATRLTRRAVSGAHAGAVREGAPRRSRQ